MKQLRTNLLSAIALAVVCLIFGCTVYDAIDEGYDLWLSFRLAFIATIPPIVAYGLARWSRSRVRQPLYVDFLAGLVLLAGVPLYIGYAMNGRTNPDTAAHLHFALAPILYLLLVTVTIGIVAVTLWILHGLRGPKGVTPSQQTSKAAADE